VGSGPIKSSIELAMEKVDAMDRLTAKELAEHRQRKFAPLGRALAMKVIEGRLRADALPAELDRYQGEERSVVKEALRSSLFGEVSPDDANGNDRILEALDALGWIENPGSLRQALGEIESEFDEEAERIRSEFERDYREGLVRRGISGTALRPNLGDARGLKVRLNEARQARGSELSGLLERHVRT
jgi:hypothetical protein